MSVTANRRKDDCAALLAFRQTPQWCHSAIGAVERRQDRLSGPLEDRHQKLLQHPDGHWSTGADPAPDDGPADLVHVGK